MRNGNCSISTLFWLAASVGLSLPTSDSLGGVLVEAHRGYSAVAPENTIASIDAASGVAQLTEWDVQLTADGEFVLMHDSTVDRTTNGSGAVTSYALAGIKTLDAGSWFGPAFVGERVPTMAEAIAAALAADLTPLIERKAGGTPLDYHLKFAGIGIAPTQFRLISFDWAFLDGLDALSAAYNLGALGSGNLTQATIDAAKAAGADFLDWEHSTITQATVDLVHANGLELHAWTVDGLARMQQLIDLGVDGITTDRPAELSSLVLASERGADLNGDLAVDADDWRQYNAGRGSVFFGLPLGEAYAQGDLDGDGDNDVADFVRFKDLYVQANGQSSWALLAAPEPNSLGLAVAASLGAAVRRRRRLRCGGSLAAESGDRRPQSRLNWILADHE